MIVCPKFTTRTAVTSILTQMVLHVSENQADPEPSYNALGNSNLSQKLGHTVFTYIH